MHTPKKKRNATYRNVANQISNSLKHVYTYKWEKIVQLLARGDHGFLAGFSFRLILSSLICSCILAVWIHFPGHFDQHLYSLCLSIVTIILLSVMTSNGLLIRIYIICNIIWYQQNNHWSLINSRIIVTYVNKVQPLWL